MPTLGDSLRYLLGNGPWVVLGLVFVTLLEQLRPARRYGSYWRQRFWPDLGAFVVVAFCSKLLQPVVAVLDERLRFLRPEAWVSWMPVWAKVLLVLLLVDLLDYWLHRAMHRLSTPGNLLWAAHRWHHRPAALTSLAGFRGSLLQRLLYIVCALVAVAAVDLHEPIGLTLLTTVNLLHEAVLHANVDLSLGPLDAVVTTPRWHRIHHAAEARLQHSNYGMHFTVWDRLFGTYTDPSRVPAHYPLGVEESAGPLRNVIGV